jgi:hypothetical protein
VKAQLHAAEPLRKLKIDYENTENKRRVAVR